MLDTLASLNEYAEEFGITEVLPLFFLSINYVYSSFTAQPLEFLCN